MNSRHLQGWSFISSALIMALFFVNAFLPFDLTGGMPYVIQLLSILSSICFIVGLTGIQAVQPKIGTWGKIGLVLMLIPALNKLLTDLIILFAKNPLAFNQRVSSVWDALASVGVVYLGYIIVGWLTIQARVFPTWIGWLLFVVGFFYDVIWLLTVHGIADSLSVSFFMILYVLTNLLEVIALIGYGTYIIRYRVPRKKRTQHSVQRTAGSLRDL